MTEQPVTTEQQFLGNERPARLEDAILLTVLGKPLDADQQSVLAKVVQSYVPNAHRAVRAKLLRPATDKTTAVILFDQSVAAAAKLLKAREASERAEAALKEALAAEDLADVESVEADRQLLDYIRKEAAK